MNSIFYVLFLAITQKIQFKYSLNYQKYEKSIKCNNAQKKNLSNLVGINSNNEK